MKSSTITGIVGAVVCALAIYQSARVGFARTYALQALAVNGVTAAEKSTRLLPNDAEVHAARGVVLQRTEAYPEGCRELERAVQLRPRDYFLWIMLAVTRDLNDDQSGGVEALRQSVELAPYYARPRWLLGNMLLRTGQIDEGFEQLRRAEESDPTLLPSVIDLAWGVSQSDPANTIALVEPRGDDAHLALAIFLATHEQGTMALDEFRKVGRPAAAAADQLISRLIAARSFAEAFEVWTKMHCAACRPAAFVNGDFEDDVDIDNHGFGWQITANTPDVVISLDAAERLSGARSLHLDFHGNATTAETSLVSQTIVVQAGSHYKVSLQAMTLSFASAAGPMVRVLDASDPRHAILAQSAIAIDHPGWQPYSVSFTAGSNTPAVQVIINRADCPNGGCGAFGTLWLDSFQMDQEVALR
ncbi:MAG TPA: carbohydrate binding domain-containing protein [Pyrinomonadaceae bacterium]|nr:carbohydrate binding domain-containing protein [Pyrinomonadaceae bacterium]